MGCGHLHRLSAVTEPAARRAGGGAGRDTSEEIPGAPIADAVATRLREDFIGWQCRIRQYAMRRQGGRPSPGMTPALVVDGEELARIVVLLNRRDSEELALEFRFLFQRTHDQERRRADVVAAMAASFFQQPGEFSDTLSALFFPGFGPFKRLLGGGAVGLRFEQHNRRYCLPCAVRRLDEGHSLYRFAYWHNLLFNPNIPPGISVLAFAPDWAGATAGLANAGRE